MAVNLITFSGQNVLPEYDAEARKGMTGFTTMPAVTLSGSNLIHLTECYGMIAGYQFHIDAMDVPVSLPTSDRAYGGLYLHLDVSDIDTPLTLIAEATPTYAYGNGVYDMEIAQFTATPSGVFLNTAPRPTADAIIMRHSTAYNVNDIVYVPGSYYGFYYCVSAGTTNVNYAPLFYQSLYPQTDVIEDGTAQFMAIDLIGLMSSL